MSQMMEQMKNNAVLASGTKSIQELVDTNAFGIRLRGQFEAYNQELFGWMQDLGRAYSKGGQNEVAKRVEQIKEIAMQAYESLAPYTEYVRYFNESSSQEDEYAQTKNEDPGGHHVLGALQSFASGAWNAGASAISNGIYHDTTNKGDSNLAYTAGEIAGGLAAAGIGVIETIEGITVASAGIIASPETAGVAAVIIAPSLAVAALGVTTIGNGVSKIADGVHNFSSEGTGEVGKYDTKIKWGINDINARPYGKGFFGERIPQSNPRVDGYELKINPNNESYYLPHPNGGYVQFENLAGNVLQDGKLIIKPKSFYHVDDLPQFAKDKVLQEALRQQESALAAGYKVEWLVSDAEAVKQLTNLFKTKNIDIIVKYFPE
ncbi:hypothetical protein [Paenibacillus sp. FSL H8-0034]|uniref:hypothetical protein n=1 Tax=Paenibacillus sp. FSL H8-0034 TaxID=2954671 RepID=UPI0030F5AD55